MKEVKMQIKVQTLPNGYALTVNGEEFMYFNELDLLAGFNAHVGLADTSVMDKGTILNTLFSMMMGSTYNDAVTSLKNRVGLLSSQYQATIDRMDKACEYVASAEKMVNNMQRRMDDMNSQLKGVEVTNSHFKKKTEELLNKVKNIETRADYVTQEFADLEKAANEKSKEGKQPDPKSGENKPNKKEIKSKKEDEPSKSDNPEKKRTGRRNKEADAAVAEVAEKQSLEEMEEKLKKHWDKRGWE